MMTRWQRAKNWWFLNGPDGVGIVLVAVLILALLVVLTVFKEPPR